MAITKATVSQSEKSGSAEKSIIYLWCLRMLMACGGYRKFVGQGGFSDDEVVATLGLEKYAEKDVKRSAAIKKLKQMHADAEKQSYALPRVLVDNLSRILDRISLGNVDTDILMFSILLHTEEGLEECANTLGNIDKSRLIRFLAIVLDHPQRDVSKALSMNGQLALSGLLKIDSSWSRDMARKIDLMNGLADNLLVPDVDAAKLFAGSFIEGREPKLGNESFAHLSEPYALMKRYLEQALQHTDGVNILLYGRPGTGKTEMVRTLVRDAGAALYEVSMEDADGDPLSGKERFSAYQLSQQLLHHTPGAVIMFDEIEDVFPESSIFGKPEPGNTEKKAWINRLLESNRVPAFWLSNKVRQIDPAFLRRFDYVLEMSAPTNRMREQIFSACLDDVPVSERWLKNMSANRNLLPAHIEKAAKVVRYIATNDTNKNEAVLESVLEGTQEILGLRIGQRSSTMTTGYSLDYVSANMDIHALVAGLKRGQRGNICFYGPPGTGKTALGQYIAEHLDKPLIVKRASDILSKWVGGTEKNIAEMFKEAKKESGVLLLDEADSFLRDRRGANQSWEVTQVNELLVQMENFNGLFICSTNLMDDLDQASLRRFAIKVEFDYLKPDQAWTMLQKECIGKATARDRQTISMMTNLTPGDFAAVKKRLEILGLDATPEVLVRELHDELAVKDGGTRNPIGFLSNQ
jgi:SpoVK/Ycf46/Vps4 family AAA+-type ATPase